MRVEPRAGRSRARPETAAPAGGLLHVVQPLQKRFRAALPHAGANTLWPLRNGPDVTEGASVLDLEDVDRVGRRQRVARFRCHPSPWRARPNEFSELSLDLAVVDLEPREPAPHRLGDDHAHDGAPAAVVQWYLGVFVEWLVKRDHLGIESPADRAGPTVQERRPDLEGHGGPAPWEADVRVGDLVDPGSCSSGCLVPEPSYLAPRACRRASRRRASALPRAFPRRAAKARFRASWRSPTATPRSRWRSLRRARRPVPPPRHWGPLGSSSRIPWPSRRPRRWPARTLPAPGRGRGPPSGPGSQPPSPGLRAARSPGGWAGGGTAG